MKTVSKLQLKRSKMRELMLGWEKLNLKKLELKKRRKKRKKAE